MKYTPMIEQYLKIKKEYSDMFLFYRLGDFYEMFFDDAINASRILEITLTGREAGVEERIPMCGVPFHSASNYIDILINNGHKVAICEQVSEPGQGKIVERKVVQVITPGTYMNYKNLDENNYLGCVYFDKAYYLSFCDIMTGDSKCAIFSSREDLESELYKNNIKEILNLNADVINFNDFYVTKKDIVNNLNYISTYNIDDETLKIVCNNLLHYIEITQNKDISNLKKFETYNKNNYLYITNYSIKNLEVTQNMANESKKGSLLSVIDKTKTSAGSRKIKMWLENPLININEILIRQNIVESFIDNYFIKVDLQNLLKEVYDIERLASKISYNMITPKELVNLKSTLNKIPHIKELLGKIESNNIQNINLEISDLKELRNFLNNAIDENAGMVVKDGNVIKEGFNNELDNYRNAQTNGSNMLLEVEQREKEKTNIKTLKIGYNKIFGYYIEVTKGNLKNFNAEELGYQRKQTLANCERFVTDELKEIEEYIISSNSKIEDLETKLFQEVKSEARKYIFELQNLANKLSDIDVYAALATVAEDYNYVKPLFNDDNKIEIIEGRHPIVERMVNKNSYISNNCNFNAEDNILLITGPNMSGKSTYMRQLALIVILAQIGSYVPCLSANIPIFDKIFTRIGASDDLAGGKSTFMVEMMEAKNALIDSTKNSLLIFDEIGRGTSTYDGIALAQSILEYINNNIECKTLFSTHYHELTKLEKEQQGIRNIHVSAKEENGELTFLYKIKNGAIEKSYGIHVAKLAELPAEVINNANNILNKLENDSYSQKENKTPKNNEKKYENIAFNLDDSSEKLVELEKAINNIDLFNITPLEAMQILNELKNKVK